MPKHWGVGKTTGPEVRAKDQLLASYFEEHQSCTVEMTR